MYGLSKPIYINNVYFLVLLTAPTVLVWLARVLWVYIYIYIYIYTIQSKHVYIYTEQTCKGLFAICSDSSWTSFIPGNHTFLKLYLCISFRFFQYFNENLVYIPYKSPPKVISHVSICRGDTVCAAEGECAVHVQLVVLGCDGCTFPVHPEVASVASDGVETYCFLAHRTRKSNLSETRLTCNLHVDIRFNADWFMLKRVKTLSVSSLVKTGEANFRYTYQLWTKVVLQFFVSLSTYNGSAFDVFKRG